MKTKVKITIKDLEKLLEEAKNQLITLGYPEIAFNHYELEINSRFTKRLGDCEKVGNSIYRIRLNEKSLDYETLSQIQDTIMHELIHSISGCMNHGTKFHKVANAVNKNYNQYNIGTYATNSSYVDIYRKQFKKKRDKKYSVNCLNCNKEWRYSRETKLIKELKKDPFSERFKCPYCGHKHFTYDNI